VKNGQNSVYKKSNRVNAISHPAACYRIRSLLEKKPRSVQITSNRLQFAYPQQKALRLEVPEWYTPANFILDRTSE